MRVHRPSKSLRARYREAAALRRDYAKLIARGITPLAYTTARISLHVARLLGHDPTRSLPQPDVRCATCGVCGRAEAELTGPIHTDLCFRGAR
jgi:hypothetical protein